MMVRGKSSRANVQRPYPRLAIYACCRQRAIIQTYAVIIATTVNTIRYSISFSQCLTGGETGVSGLSTTSGLTHPGQG